MLLKNRGKIEQDVKSRIVFEVPEGEKLGIARNRSYSGYKPTSEVAKIKRQENNPYQDRSTAERQLTIESIKKKYGFANQGYSGRSVAETAFFNQPLQAISNTQALMPERKRIISETQGQLHGRQASISDIKFKYEARKEIAPNFMSFSQSQNESMVLQKYKIDHRREVGNPSPYRENLHAKIDVPKSVSFDLPKSVGMRPPVPPQIISTQHKRLPSALHQDTTPNFCDQMKIRNKQWLENLDRVQDRIRCVLER